MIDLGEILTVDLAKVRHRRHRRSVGSGSRRLEEVLSNRRYHQRSFSISSLAEVWAEHLVRIYRGEILANCIHRQRHVWRRRLAIRLQSWWWSWLSCPSVWRSSTSTKTSRGNTWRRSPATIRHLHSHEPPPFAHPLHPSASILAIQL